jgi:hypothetical protein
MRSMLSLQYRVRIEPLGDCSVQRAEFLGLVLTGGGFPSQLGIRRGHLREWASVSEDL